MTTYRYKAYDRSGRLKAGTIEAAGPKDALQAIKNTGLYPSGIAESEARGGLLRRRGIPVQLLALTTRQLATLLSTGTALSDALSVLAENTVNPLLKSSLKNINESVRQGSSFARALEAHQDVFSPYYRGIVAAGEAGGSLDKMLPRLADYLETRARISSEVKAALTYPALMTAVGASVISFLFVFVMPRITGIFEETEASLPLITVVLIGITGFIGRYWPLILGAAGAAAYALYRYSKTARGKALKDEILLRAPWLGNIVSSFYISSFARTLGSLLKGGVHMLKALRITRDSLDNTVYTRILNAAIEDTTGGASLSSSLGMHKELPPILVHMINVGERSGSLDEMLFKAADSYEAEFSAGVKRSLNLLEPLLILAMGLAVGFIVLAILLPIFSLNQLIR